MEDKPLIPVRSLRQSSALFKKQSRVTLKMRLWLKDYLSTGNATKSAQKIYKCSIESAKTIGSDNLSKVDYPAMMELSGITDKLLLTKVKQGLNSKRIFSSHTEPDKVIPDMIVRHKYLETALKLKNRLTDKPTVIVSDKTLILDAIDKSDITS